MARRKIEISFDGKMRNDLNDNFEELYEKVKITDDLINGAFDSAELESNIRERMEGLEREYTPELNRMAQQLIDRTTGRRKLSFKDAWIAWENGEKFPVAFLGDSTVDGVNTTGHVKNVLGTDHRPPNAFPSLLENLIKMHTGNTSARIYNAGFSGKTATWGFQNIERVFEGEYQDAEMIGIGFGINDRLTSDLETYENNFHTNIENIILWCFENHYQPFLLTTQAILQPSSSYTQYPFRDSKSIESVANRVKKDLAKKYNIDLIDINEVTERFIKTSAYPVNEIISDTLHFGDVGHKFEADFLFGLFCPRVVFVERGMLLDFSSQGINTTVDENKLEFETELLSKYHKIKAYYDKGNKDNNLIQDFLVFSLDTDLSLYFVFIQNKKDEFPLPSTDTQRPYTILNGTKTVMNNVFINSHFETEGKYLLKRIGNLSMGLNHMQLWSGQFNRVSASGFILEKNLYETDNILTYFKDASGNITRNSVQEYANYVEDSAVFKIDVSTNIAAATSLLIPLVDKRSAGIGINLTANYISLLAYPGPLSGDPTPFTTLIRHNFEAGANSKERMREMFVKVSANNKISVFQRLGDAPLLEYTASGRFGGFFIGNYIFVNANVANESYATVKTVRLN